MRLERRLAGAALIRWERSRRRYCRRPRLLQLLHLLVSILRRVLGLTPACDGGL